jgi:hypothetical protein
MVSRMERLPLGFSLQCLKVLVWVGKVKLSIMPFSPLIASSVLVVTDKGGEQQKGEIGKDVALCLLEGLDAGGDGRVGEVLYSALCIYPLVVLGDSNYSDWALNCAKEICHIVGIPCVGHEEQSLALLFIIKEAHHHEVLVSLSNLSIKGNRELRNFECSINPKFVLSINPCSRI